MSWQIVVNVKGVPTPLVRTYVDQATAAADFEVIRASHQRQRWVEALDWLSIDGQNIVSAHLEEVARAPGPEHQIEPGA